ncbi:MAG: mobile mystery protein B [Acidobacteria bacterium]|nr:mobile mystery protein B [Acidobacteriota bacterium]
MKLLYPAGATPLDPNEIVGLIPNIRLQSELNAREEENIVQARRWAYSSRNRRLKRDLLSNNGLKLLHRKMFVDVWRWAGAFRISEKNIGVLSYQITTQLHNLCEDVKTQLQHRSYPLDECAIHFHHRLTKIHPFPNGNGRHARLACDLLLHFNGGQDFTWGKGKLSEAGAVRSAYIDALRQADAGDIAPLLQFARE